MFDNLRASIGEAVIKAGVAILPPGVLEVAQANTVARVAELVDDWRADPTGDGGYQDDTFPERLCDYEECRKPYRGPAVYCSRDCATLDNLDVFGAGVSVGDPPDTDISRNQVASIDGTDWSAEVDFRPEVIGTIGGPTATVDVRTGRRVVDAYRLPAEDEPDDFDGFLRWLDRLDIDRELFESSYDQKLICHSPDDAIYADPGDWLIRCPDALVRPVKPQIFDQFFIALQPRPDDDQQPTPNEKGE